MIANQKVPAPSCGTAELSAGVKALYAAGQTDYSLDPLVLVDEHNQPIGRIADGDTVIFCCRRGEREVELTEAFTDAHFPHFQRPDLSQLNFHHPHPVPRKIHQPAGRLRPSKDQGHLRRDDQPRRLAPAAHL